MSDRVGEFFEIGDQIRTIKADMKDLMEEHELTEEIDKLSKELKELKEKRLEDESIGIIKEKVKTLRERQDLIKDIILVEMKESGQTSLKFENKEIVIAESLKFKKAKD